MQDRAEAEGGQLPGCQCEVDCGALGRVHSVMYVASCFLGFIFPLHHSSVDVLERGANVAEPESLASRHHLLRTYPPPDAVRDRGGAGPARLATSGGCASATGPAAPPHAPTHLTLHSPIRSPHRVSPWSLLKTQTKQARASIRAPHHARVMT